MLRFGTISAIDANKGLAKVSFDEDDIVTDWLPVLQKKTLKDKHFNIPDSGEHVACIMDEHAEKGVILGAIYSKSETPGSVKGEDVSGFVFENGDLVEFDRSSRKMRIKTNTTEVQIAPAGPSIKKGSESLKTIFIDLLDQIIAETHTTPLGPTSPPVNVAAYTAIKTRITNFFDS